MAEDLKPGTRIKDNDPRVGTRILTIQSVGMHSVTAKSATGRVVTISNDRIHTDGKPRRSGFSLTF